MTGQGPIPALKRPAECSRDDLDHFRQMVLGAGEVRAAGLDERIGRAEILAFLRNGRAIIGVAALKRPSREYSRGVFKNARAKNAAHGFGLELGWVVIESAHRGHSYSRRVVEALVAYANREKIFATSITTRIAMHKALTGCSFERDGVDWQSKLRPDGHLFLFVHNGHSG